MIQKSGRLALKVAVIYVLVAGIWILFSDELVGFFVSNPQLRTDLSVFKGWAFVLLTAVLLHRLIKTLFARWSREADEQESQARAALQFSDRAVNLASVATAWITRDARIVRVNRATCAQLGYTEEEMLKLTIHDLAPAMPAERWPAHWAELRERKHLAFESEHRHKDGRLIPMEVELNWMEFGGQEYNFAFARDITTRKQAEKDLRESEERYRQLFEMESDAVILVDSETHRYLDVNLATQKLYGYTREEFLQMTPENVSDEPEKTRDHINAGDARVPFRWHRKKNGDRFAVEITANHINYKGRRTALVALRDVTERLRADELLQKQLALQQQLANIAHTVPGVIYSFQLRPDGSVCFPYSSPAICELFGFEPEELSQDASSIFALIYAEDVGRVRADIAESARTLTTWCGEFRYHHPTRGEIWISGRSEPQAQPDGSILWQGFTAEATDRKRAELALRESEVKFSRMFNSSPVATSLSILKDGRILDVNDAWLKMYERSRDEAVGRTVFELGVWVDLEQRTAILALLKEHGSVHDFELKVQSNSGRVMQVLWSCMLVDIGGESCMLGSALDITDRKQAVADLRQNQQLLRTVIDLVPHFIFAKDINSRHLFVNNACAAANGMNPEEMVGKTDLECLLDPKQAEAFMRDDREVITSGRQKFVAEERLTDAAGQTRILQTNKIPFVLPGETTAAVVGVAVDITDIKKAGEALRLSEERFQLLWRQSADGIRLTDAAGTVVMANSAYYQLMERPPEAVEGRPMCDVYLPENRVEILNHHRINFTARDVAERVETKVTLWNGKKLWLEVSNSFMERPGTEPLLLAMFRDVTGRKQSEDQMRLQSGALTAAANAIFISNVHGAIEWVNPAFCVLTGYTSAEVIGQNPRLFKSGEHSREFYAELWHTILTGNVWHGELVNRRKDGSLYNEYMTVTPVKDAAGTITHFVAIKQDITERKQLNARLQQAEKMEAIGTLAGGIAHDFNNILAAMFGYGYLLQSDCEGNAAATENIAEILKSAARAKDLVQQILTFSRQREQKRQVVRLHTVVKEAIKFLRASLPAGIKIDMELQDHAPPVFADPSQIYQVTLNLATNSFHAMEGSHGTLTVSLREFIVDATFRREHPEITTDSCVQLVVADTGHGMKPEVLAHIFEPFFTTKAVGKGTGLGLAVVHGIVKSHDGVIEVDSQAGQGTSFKIYFPARSAEQIVMPVQSSQMPRGNGQRILVVDDEIAITGVFQKLLTRLNYRVTTANSPLAGLEIFRREPEAFALVITDLTMPDMDGLELATKIHELNPRVTVVLASGQTTEVTDARLEESGVATVIEKPVVNATLARLVNQFVTATSA